VAIIRDGEVVATGTPDGIGGRSRAVGEVRFRLPAGFEGDDLPRGSGGEVRIEAGVLHVRTTALVADLHLLTGWALEHGLDLDLRVSRPTLGDVYLELTAEVAS
jgi:ABC-2 type transport system ATP-binding protein